MTKNKIKLLLILAFLVIVVCCTQMQQPVNNSNNTTAGNVGTSPTPVVCNASADWVNNPQSGPNEIPGGGANLCQFHQFSWQWFLALMNATPDNKSRVYQNQQEYPPLQAAGTNSCTATNVKTSLFVRTRKDDDNQNDFISSDNIKQAGGGATIYDQNRNVVFYEARFSRGMCALADLPPIIPPPATMFPAGTTEIKVSYRVITPAEAPNYVNINADINGDGKPETLGMVGFHLVKSTALHPEFIWATFEHKQNVPECQAIPDPNAKPWSFTSPQCAAQLPNSVNQQQCSFNNPATPSPTPVISGGTPTQTPTPVISGGTPTQICRVYHDSTIPGNGTNPGDNQYQANITDIDMLNAQLVGPSGHITTLPDESPLAVLKNYMLVGALWVNDPTKPATLDNQRGSIQLANTTMETTHQQHPDPHPDGKPNPDGTPFPYTGTSNLRTATNCFACHTYTPDNNVELSHIFTSILGTAKKK